MKFFSLFILTISILLCPFDPAHAEISAVLQSAKNLTIQRDGIYSSGPDLVDSEILSFLRSRGIHDIAAFAEWLLQNTSYKKDLEGDIWASPSETLKKRNGDCEDFAFLSERVARLLGYESHILILSNRQNSHALCAFEMDGVFFIFNNNRLQKTRARSLEELARILTSQTEFTTCKRMNTESHPWEQKARVAPKGILISG